MPITVAETSDQETKHHTQRVGELRFTTEAGPEELTLQALSPEQSSHKDIINSAWQHTIVGKGVNKLV